VTGLLRYRLRMAGFDAESVQPAAGGVISQAGIATLYGGGQVFAKTLPSAAPSDVFEVEAEGLRALRQAGLRTPEVLLATPKVLVLEPLPQRQDTPDAWEDLGRAFAALHTSTTSDRFGWHRDGWRDRMPLLHLREVLSVIAHGDDDWGAVAYVRDVTAPFRRG
jgi:fructosamine-3-kinase